MISRYWTPQLGAVWATRWSLYSFGLYMRSAAQTGDAYVQEQRRWLADPSHGA